jgi:hypothetical protein
MPKGHFCRWRLGSIRSYNPEQIMLSAAVRRTSRDVSIMKEKLIFSGEQPAAAKAGRRLPCFTCSHTHVHTHSSLGQVYVSPLRFVPGRGTYT